MGEMRKKTKVFKDDKGTKDPFDELDKDF